MRLTLRWGVVSVVAASLVAGALPAYAVSAAVNRADDTAAVSQPDTVEQDITASADTTLQTWKTHKTQSFKDKPYIGALYPTTNRGVAPKGDFGLFGEKFNWKNENNTVDAKLGLVTFPLGNLKEAPSKALVQLTYFGYRTKSDANGKAQVGLVAVDTSKCVGGAADCSTDTATWNTRPVVTINDPETDVFFATDFPFTDANKYLEQDKGKISKKKAVVFDVTAAVAEAVKAGKQDITFALGAKGHKDLRFVSLESATPGAFTGLTDADKPTLKVTVLNPEKPDMQAVKEARDAAHKLLESLTGSADGADVPASKQWVTAEQVAELAKLVGQADQALQGEESAKLNREKSLELAKNLKEKTAEVEKAAKPGTKAEEQEITAFNEALKAAEAALAEVKVSADGTDVKSTEQWVTAEQNKQLADLVQQAKTVAESPNPQQEAVKKLTESLSSSTAEFVKAKQAGTLKSDVADLKAVVEQAKAALAVVVESTDGAAVDASKKWATKEQRAALEALVKDAEAAVAAEGKDLTAEEVKELKDKLAAGIEKFNTDAQSGKKADDAAVAALNKAVADAKAASAAVKVSVDGADVPSSQKWVPQAESEKLAALLEQAEKALTEPNLPQAEAQKLTKALTDGIAAYTAAQKPGILKSDVADLKAVVEQAKAALAAVVESTDGAAVDASKKWATKEQRAALEALIKDAEVAVAAEGKDLTKDEVAAVVKALQEGIDSFVKAAQQGSKAVPVAPTKTPAAKSELAATGAATAMPIAILGLGLCAAGLALRQRRGREHV